ncbi:expressed unknown protein [Seminavis robusta]|uniref:Uncharacterized protein n=1 Tax=Seminavis robusta TaxID=568900 RepID=A0A9N8H9K5_9STRA|nr:expressed unknown protein [Seminavis robusta]|eukprot:Sro195_g083100.1 n/a (226) ;mRNA; r:13136-13813
MRYRPSTPLIFFAYLVSSCAGDWTESLHGYFSYKDAACQDSSTIAGTAVMSYDDDDFTAMYGMEFDYEGSCLYYVGGSIDIYSYDIDKEIFGEGVCTECYGMVGCSTDGSCDNFMTYTASVRSSSSGYQLTGSKTRLDNETLQELKEPALGLQNSVQNAVFYHENRSSGAPQDDPRFYILGGAIGCVSLLGLVAVLERLRQRRVAREQKVLELSDGAGGDYFNTV